MALPFYPIIWTLLRSIGDDQQYSQNLPQNHNLITVGEIPTDNFRKKLSFQDLTMRII